MKTKTERSIRIEAVLRAAARRLPSLSQSVSCRRRHPTSRSFLVGVAALPVLFLAAGSVPGTPCQDFPCPSLPLRFVTLASGILVALVPLRLLGAQRLAAGLLVRARSGYKQALQDFSRALTGSLTEAALAATMAEPIEALFQPQGLAIVFVRDRAYVTALAHGRLAADPLWRQGSHFTPGHPVVAALASRHCLVDVARFSNSAPEADQAVWQRVADSGADLLMPMVLHGRLTGWVALGRKPSHVPYDEAGREFLSALADQSSVALGTVQLQRQMQQRATELTLLAMVSSAISSALDLEQVLEIILESVIKVANCHRSAILVLEDGQTLSLRLSRGLGDALGEALRQIYIDPAGTAAQAMVTGEPLVIPDVLLEPHLAQLLLPAGGGQFRGLVDLPLIAREEPLGILRLFFDDVHGPSDSELELLATFANQAAIAIANARLHDTASRERARDLDLEQFREDLTSMVIHNLKGPLAGVISSLETLREMKESGEEVADQLLSIALESGRKLDSRLGTVLWLRRLEDPQIPLRRRPAHLGSVVDSVLDDYRAKANLSQVKMESLLPPDLPCVLIDQEIISHVLSNLVDNALKYTPAQGSIKVRGALDSANHAQAVVCSVADSGSGVPAHMRDAIFHKFCHDGEGTGRHKGMGIGLHYCKLAVEAHGGRIWVDSAEGQGSIFSFTLPVGNGG